VIAALVLALLIKTFLVQAFYIPSASMENTLQGGNPLCNGCGASPGHPFDRVLVNKLVYDFRSPRRGEVVVFKRPPGWPNESRVSRPHDRLLRAIRDAASEVGLAPSGSSDFVKRVIGVGGDHVVCCNAARQITVNGHALSEPYIYLAVRPASQVELAYTPFEVTVPHGDLFVMGDHRDDSSDSRVHGFVPVSDVIGRASVVIWPIADWKTIPVPSTFHQTGLSAAGSPRGAPAAGAVALAPIAIFRRRRRRGRRLATYPAGDACRRSADG
jgi:signal peptidase I